MAELLLKTEKPTHNKASSKSHQSVAQSKNQVLCQNNILNRNSATPQNANPL